MTARREFDEIREQLVDGLQESVRSLREQLAEAKGETTGAVRVAAEISRRASETDNKLATLGRNYDRVARDAQAMVRTLAELVVDIRDGRDAEALAELVVDAMTERGIGLAAEIQFVQNQRSWQGMLRGPAPVRPVSSSPVMAAIHAVEDRIQAEAEHARADATADASEDAGAMAPASR